MTLLVYRDLYRAVIRRFLGTFFLRDVLYGLVTRGGEGGGRNGKKHKYEKSDERWRRGGSGRERKGDGGQEEKGATRNEGHGGRGENKLSAR